MDGGGSGKEKTGSEEEVTRGRWSDAAGVVLFEVVVGVLSVVGRRRFRRGDGRMQQV